MKSKSRTWNIWKNPIRRDYILGLEWLKIPNRITGPFPLVLRTILLIPKCLPNWTSKSKLWKICILVRINSFCKISAPEKFKKAIWSPEKATSGQGILVGNVLRFKLLINRKHLERKKGLINLHNQGNNHKIQKILVRITPNRGFPRNLMK